MTDKVLKIGDEEFEPVSEVAVFTSKELVDIWERLGRPEDPLSESGEKLMRVIITVWEELYPDESKKWTEDRKEYKLNEFSARDQVHKHTGRSLASYPFPIFQMMRRLFPKFDPVKRENCMKMVSKFPMFLMAKSA